MLLKQLGAPPEASRWVLTSAMWFVAFPRPFVRAAYLARAPALACRARRGHLKIGSEKLNFRAGCFLRIAVRAQPRKPTLELC